MMYYKSCVRLYFQLTYNQFKLLSLYFFYKNISVEELGIKEFLPPYLDPKLQPSELTTGVCFASGGAGYDDFTSKLQVLFMHIILYNNNTLHVCVCYFFFF